MSRDWYVDRLIDWLGILEVVWDWYVDWLIDWLGVLELSRDWLVDWLIDWLGTTMKFYRFKLDRACIEKLESEINQSRVDTPRPAMTKVSQMKSSVYSSSNAGPSPQTVGSHKNVGRGARSTAAGEATPHVYNVRKAFDQVQDDSTAEGDNREDDGSSVNSGDEEQFASGDDEESGPGRGDVFTLSRPDYFTIPSKVNALQLEDLVKIRENLFVRSGWNFAFFILDFLF